MQEINISVLGLASQRVYGPFIAKDLKQSLMSFLQEMNITIASSCSGEGICKKCVIQDDVLSCQISIEEFIKNYPQKQVWVSYL